MFAYPVAVVRGLGAVTRAIPDVPPVIPPDASDALIHWELAEASGATADNTGTLGATADGTIAGTVDYELPSLINGVATKSMGMGPDGRVQRAHLAALEVASATIAIYGQADSIPSVGANRLLVAKDWIAEPGGVTLDVYNDGGTLRVRGYNRSAAGTALWVGSASGIGNIPLHTGFLVILRIINGAETSIWLRIAGGAMVKLAQISSGAGLASNNVPLRLGCYLNDPGGTATDVAFFVGLLKRFQFWGRALEDAEIAALPAPVSALTFDGFSGGTITDDTTGSISIPGATRPASGYVCKIDTQPSNGTVISETGGTSWGYDTNAASTGADSFTGHIEAGGNSSPVETISFSVGEAPDGITLASMTAFTTSRQRVTTLSGWPSGRTPKEVLLQSGLCHGYVRRAWKTGNNDGTYMDFQPGWRQGSGTITIVLDNDALLDLNFTVNHTIPTPGSGGLTRTLDKLGGGNFTTWTSAIAGCATNDVLVVRARVGGEVYPVDVQVGGAVSTANGVKVVAHPADLAEGRRPRIHLQGTTFARYADDLNNGHWEIHQALGGIHGNVWRTTQVVGTNKVICGVSYRTAAGELRRTFCYTNTPNTPGALARLTDSTYPRAKGEPDPNLSTLDLYMGPGHYLHSDGRLYIRLSPLTNSVGAKAVNSAAGLGPNPPAPWTEHMPASENPNNVQLYITSSNQAGGSLPKPSANMNYGLRINGTSGWTIENLDFVGGGNIIECHNASALLVRGVRVLGYVSANTSEDVIGNGVIVRTAHFLEAFDASTITVDRCELWGGQVPWYDWRENKGTLGIYGANMKFRVLGYGVGGSTVNRPMDARFTNTLFYGHPVAIWQGGRALNLKFHQSKMVLWGMDGALAIQTPRGSLEYVRCQLFEWSYAGWVQQAQPDDGVMYFGYNLCTNFRPFMHDSGYWNTSYATNNAYMCGGSVVGHETYREIPKHYLYNNTSIGAHHHRYTPAVKNSGGSLVGMSAGAGACMWPNNRNNAFLEWISRNNIAAVRPNGSLGSDRAPWGPSRDSHVGVIFHANHVGWSRGGSFVGYSSNYNIYHRGSGMPTISGQDNGVITTVNSGTTEAARTTIAQVRTDTGQENNGSIEDPLFVGSWDATKPDSELHSNAFWCLQSGSPATSGGDTTDRSWRDVDFGSQITYAGNSWRGCMDPDASAVEQQVGPLGPLPSDL